MYICSKNIGLDQLAVTRFGVQKCIFLASRAWARDFLACQFAVQCQESPLLFGTRKLVGLFDQHHLMSLQRSPLCYRYCVRKEK